MNSWLADATTQLHPRAAATSGARVRETVMFTASDVRAEETRIAIRRGELVCAVTERYAEVIVEETELLIREQLSRRARHLRADRFVTIARKFPLAPAAFDLAQKVFLGREFEVSRQDSADGRVAQMRVSW